MKREIAAMHRLEPTLESAWESARNLLNIAFYGVHEPTSIGMLYPYVDVVSIFPPGLDFTAFDWYSRGISAPGAPRWSEAPFIDLGTGWMMDVAMAVSAGGRPKGVAVLSIPTRKLVARALPARTAEALAILGRDTAVVGATSRATELLGVRAIEDADFLRQAKVNRLAEDKNKLVGGAYPEELGAVAARIAAGEESFIARLGPARLRFIVARSPETGFIVLGVRRSTR